MKHLIFVVAILLSSYNIFGQLTHTGSVVSDFIQTDFYGTAWPLYTFLDQGKAVVVNLFDTGDSISWAYHQSESLKDFYNVHNSTDVQVFAFNRNGDYYDLLGTGEHTLGDWLSDIPYPTIEVPNSWLNTIVETVPPLKANYLICPDRRIYEIGLVDADSLYQLVLTCNTVAHHNDAQLTWTDMDKRANCPGESRKASVILTNMGDFPLTSAEVVIKADNQVLQTYAWSGNLAPYQMDTVVLNDVISDGTLTNVQLFTRQPNGVNDPNTANDTLSFVMQPAVLWDDDKIYVDIQTDGYGHQIYWDVKDDAGVTIDSGGNTLVGLYDAIVAPEAPYDYQDLTHYNDTVSLAGVNTACLTIRVLSGMGYGTCCTWGSGYIKFKKGDETIFNFTDFGRRAYAKITSTLVATDDAPDLVNLKAYPNPTDGQINISFSLPQAADVGIEILNIMGQRVLALPPSRYMSGTQTIPLELLQVPNGMYWAVLRTKQGTEAVKFVVAR